ncbi:MAG: VOC family protein [Erysipelotrichales bacterium]
MKHAWNIIMTSKLEESVKYYEDVLGLKVSDTINGPLNIVFMNDEAGLSLELIEDKNAAVINGEVVLVYTTPNLEKTISELNKKGYDTGEIISPNPNLQFINILDPNGVKLQIQE